MTEVSVREARDRLSQLIKSVQEGSEVVIASHGRPVARLVPVPAHRGSDLLEWLDAHPLPMEMRRTPEEIESQIQAERDSWD